MPYCLPSRHRFAHDYAIFLHDMVVTHIKEGLRSGVFTVDVDLELDELAEWERLSGSDLYGWVHEKKGRVVTAEMDFKALVDAVGQDLCHFVLEGLRAASRGKLTVAYALFRKPFKDDLFLLEWLLADRAAFLERFLEGSPHSIDLTRLSEEARSSIVQRAAAIADAPDVESNRVFRYRFDRKIDNGFAKAWDQAVHLVTTGTHTATTRQNLNFLFSGHDELESQWASIYWLVPYLLYYTSFVYEALMSSIVTISDEWRRIVWLRRAIGYELWAEYTRNDPRTGTLHPSLRALLEDLPSQCLNCQATIPMHRRNLRSASVRGWLRCPRCRSRNLVERLWAEG
jgi:DNA-directed RNA polymerase subunit RPC12/RpoP